MQALLILVGLFAVYEILVSRQQITALTSTSASAAASANAPLTQPLPTYQEVSSSNQGAAGNVALNVNITSAAVALNFVPIIGPALSAAFSVIAGGLMKASAQRAAQARNENQAVGAAIPGWDAALNQVVANYNAGKIQAGDVEQFLAVPQVNDSTVVSGKGLLWVNFWNEVGPQVQPGRNGCQSGAVTQPANVSFCGGKTYGAGCCVAYDDLKNSSVNVLRALNQTEASGQPVQAQIFAVVASKYGGINRPAYTVTLQKPGPVVSSTGSFLASIGL